MDPVTVLAIVVLCILFFPCILALSGLILIAAGIIIFFNGHILGGIFLFFLGFFVSGLIGFASSNY